MTQDPGSGTPMSERMQSLLSRAVEDQLTEQRQLAGALNEVRAQLGRLGTQLESMQQGIPAAAGGGLQEGLAAMSADLREAVRLLAERLDGIARLVQQRGQDLSEIRGAIEQVRMAVDAQGRALDALDASRGWDDITASVAGLGERADAHDAGLRELRQAFTGVASRAAQLPGREDLTGALDPVVETLDRFGERLDRIEEAVAALPAIEPPPPPADDGERMAGVEASLESLHQRLAELQSRAGDTDGYEQLSDRLAALHDGLFGDDGLHQQVQALSASVASADPEQAEPAEPVDESVARAVGAAERRLADHIDQAVLALAEALLTRRRSRARLDTMPVAAAPAPELGLDDVEEDFEGDEETEPQPTIVAGPLAPYDEADDDVAGDDDDAEDDEDEDAETGVTDRRSSGWVAASSWQTPTGTGNAAAADESEPAAEPAQTSTPEESGKRKRKPWWRPGD